jgi:hypothetical protein
MGYIYKISCSSCDISKSIATGTRTFIHIDNNNLVLPCKSEWGYRWCYDCKTIEQVFLGEAIKGIRISDLENRIFDLVKSKKVGIIKFIKIQFLKSKLNKIYNTEGFNECIKYWEEKNLKPKCTSCGSINIDPYKFNFPKANSKKIESEFIHTCGGKISLTIGIHRTPHLSIVYYNNKLEIVDVKED